MVVERVDLPAGELGGQALAVPVREEAHDDDRLFDPCRQTTGHRSARPVDERVEASSLVRDPPALQACPTDPQSERCRNALFPGHPDAPDPEPEAGEIRMNKAPRRTTTTRRQEEEARPLLVGVAKEAAMRLGAVLDRELVHRRTLGRAGLPCLTNPGNYT